MSMMRNVRVGRHHVTPRALLCGTALACTLLAPRIAAAADPVYDPYAILGTFNAIVLNNLTVFTDVEGRVITQAIDGTLNSAPQFYSAGGRTTTSPTLTDTSNPNPATNTTTFTSVNAITFNNNVNSITSNGGIDLLNMPRSIPVTANGGNTVTNTPTFTMAPFQTALNGLQTSLAALTANNSTTVTGGNTLNFVLTTVNSQNTYVFNVNASDLASVSFIDFTGTAAANSSVVINVVGTTLTTSAQISDSGGNGAPLVLDGTLLANDVLWNFENATSVNLNGQWDGSILAGGASVASGSNNNIQGSVYAYNLSIGRELHNYTYQPPTPPTTPPTTPPPVPEPASMAVLATAIAGLAGLRRRRG